MPQPKRREHQDELDDIARGVLRLIAEGTPVRDLEEAVVSAIEQAYSLRRGGLVEARGHYVAADVARMFAVHPSVIIRRARVRGIGTQKPTGRWVFSAEDVEKLRPLPRGRPRRVNP